MKKEEEQWSASIARVQRIKTSWPMRFDEMFDEVSASNNRLNVFNQNIFNKKKLKDIQCVFVSFSFAGLLSESVCPNSVFYLRICKENQEHVDDWLFLDEHKKWLHNEWRKKKPIQCMCSCVECEVTLYAEIISLMTWFSLCLFFRLASNECVALGARCAHIPNVAWLLYLREVIQYMMRPLNEPSQCVNKFINLTVCSLFFCAHILWIEISITHWNVTRIVSAAFPDKASQEVKMTDKNGTLKSD